MNNHASREVGNRSRRCLVLGGRGFIGSHLTRALLEQGFQVRCFDRPQSAVRGGHEIEHPDFELFEGDFVNPLDMQRALEGVDICFHLVSTTLPKSSNADPVFDVETNLLGTVRLLTQAVEAGVAKVIFVSSGGTVYGVPQAVPVPETHPTEPVCSYGIAKLAIEKYLALFHQQHGLDYAVLRLANPFGEGQRADAGQGAVAVFLGRILRGETLEVWGDGSVIRDYIYIDDVVRALILSIDVSGDERLFNIGSGRGHSVNEVLDVLERTVGRRAIRRYRPGRTFDVPASVLCIESARRSLGWAPQVEFDEGVERFAAWMKRELAEQSLLAVGGYSD
ncbi:NAD-dependent epimerase/dehydratase family protein [bacterium M00.F.Ca.ET.228.01.1.1]|uniref:NAD-dependent epimerase/dehydratase family protein n=1 Tax=Paraburkholderia phenoliruptrix TaxID=252970 RepID=UPI001092DD94|nr:NAD-dependent epimerase/dehydratase family protein [Paraburkholderia phenoliruptrix]TGP43140.1 NAD-dependent epimerase/dehydratase family protein [bacterium M00.F.Ca.ET.228.01.1.1]TGS00578.1 NAD-dependent epimerase/dehydratase family protein [bacterium M00.F.Ca.ET.191.01.1.1]TGU04964.1 NAD-dependent epimerase/dehydratase family protein [bacterium M00.F.Ca.ET.155.01.1.1]MBW0446928.1 NAD-dependent epimerase/dehydratase family protein [Paraburkholderia phenoliruptrix]MBW9099424.1 NAD-dependent